MTTFTNTTDQVESLYVGYFGRAGDPAGTNFWVNNLNTGQNTLSQEAASFATQPEALAKYPYLANPSISNPSQFIDEVYQNLFNRAPDAAGKAYWTAQLQAAGGNPNAVGQFILNVISGATGVDSQTITNKVATARYFTETANANSISWDAAVQAQSATEIVATTNDPASVEAQKHATDNALAITTTVAGAAALAPNQPYSISDTVANETAAGAAAVLNKAVNITATGVATVAQATQIEAATNTGTTSIGSLTDTAANIAGSSNVVMNTISGAATATTAATGPQASSIAAFTKAVAYSVSDTVSAVAASTGLNEAINITTTGVGTVADATAIAAATNSGTKSVAAVTDTAAHIAGSSNAVMNLVVGAVTASDAATMADATAIAAFTKAVVYSVSDLAANLVAGAGLNEAVNVTATGTATIAQANVVAAATNSGIKSIAAVTDTAANVAASSNAVLDLVSGAVTASDAASAAQAGTLAAFTHAVVYNVSDTVAAVVGAAGVALNEAVNITATGVATVADATTIAAATNSGTKAIGSLADTSAAIAASSNAVLNNVTGTVTATTPSTVAEANIEAGFAKAVIYNVGDTGANMVAGAGLNEAVNIVVTDAATVAQAVTVVGATNTGTKVYSISDAFTTVQAALSVGGNTAVAVNNAVTLTAMGSSAVDNINMSAYTRGLTIEGAGSADIIVGGQVADIFRVTTIADFAAGESVNGLGGSDTMQFTTAGTITYGTTFGTVRAVQSVENLALATGINNVTVYEGTGLTRVTGADSPGSIFTLSNTNAAGAALAGFAAVASPSAAAVTVPGSWFYAPGPVDGVLTYFDSVAGAAVTLTLVGVAGTGTMASVAGTLRFAGTSTVTADYGTTAPNTLTVAGGAAGVIAVSTGGAVTNAGVPVTVTGGAFAPATVTGIDLSGVTGGFGSTIAIDGVTEPSLASVIGTSGNDTIALNDANFAALGRVVAIDGGLGNNTLTLGAQSGNATIGAGGILPGASTLTNIQSLNLTAGTGVWTLTLGAVAGLAVTNNGFAATVVLGGSATQTYTSGSTFLDDVTLGAGGQRVTDTDGTVIDIVRTSVANSLGSTFTSTTGGFGDILAFTNAGTIGLAATASASEMGIVGVETVVTAAGANTLNINLLENLIVDAQAAGAAATTIAGAGPDTITVLQATNAGSVINLSGVSNFVVMTDTLGGTINDTGTGALTVNMQDLVNLQILTVNSASATTINAAAVTTIAGDFDMLSVGGAGNVTINGVGAGAQAGIFDVNLLASHTGTTTINLGANSSFLVTNAANGAITVNAAALTGTETILGAHAVTVDNLFAAGGSIAGGGATGALTVNTNDLFNHTITTGLGNDTIVGVANGTIFNGGIETISTGNGTNSVSLTGIYGAGNSITGGTGVDTVTLNGTFGAASTIATAGGADVINTSAATASTGLVVNGGAGADQITVGANAGGTTTIVVGSAGNVGVSLVTDMDTITGFNASNSFLSIGGAPVTNALTSQNVATAEVANLSAVFGNVVSNAAPTDWDSIGDAIAVTIAAGSAAGNYLIINENANPTWDAATDIAVKVVGVTGVLTTANIVA